MVPFFLRLVNMSIAAGYAVLAVLLLRILLKKAPKQFSVILWGIVALRLVCPFSIESALSLIPSAEVVSPSIMTDGMPSVNTGITALNGVMNPIIGEILAPDAGDSANPLQIWLPILSALWLIGVTAMLLYLTVSYLRIRKKVETAVWQRENRYASEVIVSPFVLGIRKPRIYLPFGIDEKAAEQIMAHETAHIRRRDPLLKLLGFLLLSLFWFHPLLWLGYAFFCRDLELACDESVIKRLDREARADYCDALLSFSTNSWRLSPSPLAFGEVGVRTRIKSALHYKKPTFWLVIFGIVACAALAVCLLTDPIEPKQRYVERDAERLAQLEEQYPEYFDLDASRGLDVYVCEFAPKDFGFIPFPHSDEPITSNTAFFGYECVYGIENMRSILSTYAVKEEDVNVIAFQHPNSSHISSVYIILEGETEEDVLQRAQEYVAAIRKQLLYN